MGQWPCIQSACLAVNLRNTGPQSWGLAVLYSEALTVAINITMLELIITIAEQGYFYNHCVFIARPSSPSLCKGLAHRAQTRLRTRQLRNTSTAGLCNIMERGISQHSQPKRLPSRQLAEVICEGQLHRSLPYSWTRKPNPSASFPGKVIGDRVADLTDTNRGQPG